MLLESEKEQVKEPLEPTQQELVVKASQGAGFSETIDVSPEGDPYAMHIEEGLRRVASNLLDQDLSKDP